MKLKHHEDWSEFFIKMLYWEMELEDLEDLAMLEIFQNQMKEANQLFAKSFKTTTKIGLINQSGPLMSHQILKINFFLYLKTNPSKPF